MALHFDLSGIKNYKEFCFNEDGSYTSLTSTLIMAAMNVGLGSISENNYREFWARLNMYERIHGAYLMEVERDENGKALGTKPRPFTQQDIIDHIGLDGMNIPRESRSEWLRRIISDTMGAQADSIANTYKKQQASAVA